MTEQTQPTDAELYGDDCPGVRGDTRAPRFGEWMRGVWASARNPHRDGMYVRTVRRTGRLNPGTYHELTDGKGEFWSYPAKSTVFITREASVGTPAGAGEVVAWQSRCRPTWGNNHPWTPWELCTKGQAEDYQKTPLLHDWEYEARALYTTPQPTQAQAGAPRVSPEQWQALFDDQKRLVELANSRADISESMLKAVQVQAGTDAVVEEVANGLRRYGLTLVKTASGYDVLSLREVAAHDTKGADHG